LKRRGITEALLLYSKRLKTLQKGLLVVKNYEKQEVVLQETLGVLLVDVALDRVVQVVIGKLKGVLQTVLQGLVALFMSLGVLRREGELTLALEELGAIAPVHLIAIPVVTDLLNAVADPFEIVLVAN
jgi:hypothetical protein